MKRSSVAILSVLAIAVLVASDNTQAGVSYQDPAGAWRYKYEGTFNAPVTATGFVGGVGPAGYGLANDTGALDGTWLHDQSDKWDGNYPGGPLSDPSVPATLADQLSGNQGPSPGGAGAFTEGSTSYVRVQDSGNPEVFGWVQGNLINPGGPSDPINTNRRVYFGHDMADDGAFLPPVSGRNGERVLDNGITVSFRMRLPNSGPLHNIYTGTAQQPLLQSWFDAGPGDYNTDGFIDSADYVVWRDHNGQTFQLPNEVPNVSPGVVAQDDYNEWKARYGTGQKLGRGYPIHDEGRGMVTILQNDPDFFDSDNTIAFSLITGKDRDNLCGALALSGSICDGTAGSRTGGLIMNNLNGDAANNDIDSFDIGTLNILPIADSALSNWHEFWITITDNGGTTGTHTVNVYMDGSTTPVAFQVTESGNNNGAYAGFGSPFLEFGLSSTERYGSFDMDFLAYQLGVVLPHAAGSGSSLPAPEPSAVALVLVAAPLLTWWRCRPRRNSPVQ